MFQHLLFLRWKRPFIFLQLFCEIVLCKVGDKLGFSGFVVEVTLYISHVIYFATELILTPFHQMFKLILTISKWLRISWIVLEVLYSKPQSQEDPKLIKKHMCRNDISQ